MRKRAIVVAAAVAVLAALPASATAAEADAGCGGEWTGSAECTFLYDGGGLSVTGGFRSSSPVGGVTVTIEAESHAGVRVAVLACTTGPLGGVGVCATYSDGSMTVDIEEGQTLYCKVDGGESGTYACANYTFETW
ncbi:MAG TPA: hypothetical protein VG318_03045 [Actinomycetota bacterium]|nr:hypothetical protein [Actinomycetota bacterium]